MKETTMSPMKNIATAFAMTAGLLAAGCTDAPPTTEAHMPAATETLAVAQAGSATVLATTKIGGTYIYEVEPLVNNDVTCFVASSIFTSDAVGGNLDCVTKPEGVQAVPTRAGVVLHSSTTIGANTFYELTPETRPDLRCFLVASTYTNDPVSGAIKCQPAIAAAPAVPRPAA